MPQTATVEIKVKAGKEEIGEKSDFEIGRFVSLTEEVVRASQSRTLPLYAGPKEFADLIIVKSDFYKPEPVNGRVCGNEICLPIEVTFQEESEPPKDGKKCTFRIQRALHLCSECVHALLPTNINWIHIKNPLPRDIRVSVLVVCTKNETATTNAQPPAKHAQQQIQIPLPVGS